MRVAPRVRRWLTGPTSDPSVRWRYWTDVEGRPATDARVRAARRAIGKKGWVAALLSEDRPYGAWISSVTEGPRLYWSKYYSPNWRAIVLGDLGASKNDARVRRLAELILRLWKDDLFKNDPEICVTGNAVRYLTQFGYREHPLVQKSIDWIVDTQKSDGGWHCFPSRRGTMDSWEGLEALSWIPPAQRNEKVRRSIERGAEFFLERRLMNEGSTKYPPWFRIHYPNHYYYDVLVGLRILTRLGYGSDRRLGPALKWLRDRRRPDGTWALDADHPDNDPARGGYSFGRPVFPLRIEPPGASSRLATVEALGVLSRVEPS